MNEALAWLPAELASLPRYVVALAIGLLMGLERERNPAAKAGLRTFALTALLGVLTTHLATTLNEQWLIAVGLLLVGAMMIAAYLRDPQPAGDPGTTTVAALMLCYSLGVLVWHNEIQLAVMLGIAATMLLYFKPELRGWSEHMTRRDLLSVLQFSVLSLIILPLVPNRNYGPFGALNPYQIWWMVVLIVGVGLAGYAALRLVGQKRGAVMLGLLGGLVSSTATTLSFSRHARANSAMMPVAVIVIVLANLVVLVRLGVLSAVLAPGVLAHLLPVLIGGVLIGGLGAVYGVYHLQPQGELPTLAMGNPTELRTALGFGLMYAGVLLASAWLSDWLGTRGLYAVALISGLTDVDAITLSSLRLFNLDKLPIDAVINVIVIATLANLLFKSALALFIGGKLLARHAAAGMGTVGLGLLLSWAIMRGFSAL
ncbi:MAG TPA: MgtC/SapB family protein [Thiobacillus sp.]|nr:MAG: magnesium transporter MgtC [Hydrogenophilales bacterium 28-61-11]OYZ57597.1 MAG: magnesium transporter MgtC [Hydrogenophilales bacterium 16-61-112]OZA42971.1 MAG: magnesium transporter MgtC [Hydrogenophilales bacterium 17-61-76]HQT31977.1 MgtC/SapB family protein [Thiobacillus sp.]HQT71552.1 MgtC/SapB family protein [Thiobacillus sp.]